MLLGVHVHKKGVIYGDDVSLPTDKAIERDCENLGINSVQIFTHGPQTSSAIKMDYNLVAKATENINISVHGNYKSVGIWKLNNTTKSLPFGKELLKNFKAQMKACKKINGEGVVVHVAKQLPNKIAETMKLLKPAAKKYKVKVIIEMSASKPSKDTYEKPEQINNLNSLLDDEDWWGWCVDTAHLWCGGINNTSYNDMYKWLSLIEKKDKIIMFHINGCSKNLGQGKDEHATAFSKDDKIWNGVKYEDSGLKAVVDFANCKLFGLKEFIPMICEVNYHDDVNLKNLLKMIKLTRI